MTSPASGETEEETCLCLLAQYHARFRACGTQARQEGEEIFLRHLQIQCDGDHELTFDLCNRESPFLDLLNHALFKFLITQFA